MRRAIAALGACALTLALVACGNGTGGQTTESSPTPAQTQGVTEIKPSPDKYTWYVKSYVGMNAASVGYEAIDGFRHEAYGAGNLKIIYVAEDGTYIDPGNEEQLKEYVVTGQNIDPNTEIKYTFEVDSEGEEYDSLVNFQTIDEIVLSVAKVGETGSAPELTSIQASPDKYTHYVRDYVGRNLAECGYYSLSGNLTDAYGAGYIFFDIVTDDGSYVDPEDEAALAGYMVTSQSVEPNTPIEFTYSTDSDGNEYSNLVDSQSIKSITLNVTKAPDSGYPVGDAADTGAETSEDESGTSAETTSVETNEGSVDSDDAGVGDFRAFVDSYEDFMNEYVDFMVAYNNSDDTSGMWSEYADMMARYADMTEKVDAIDEESLSSDDLAYYTAAIGRVSARVAEIGQ
ncbi:DUF6591 domain-containing protein [Olsenella profusa]|uniref:DUF6591 domain-containing protein n=1 Tax=Olsenella profusa TaxID=138595 RepID=A0ABS2F0X3_9ACTN|nr:DUF6591 domain-containing protein [Olsenella profusa]MBM6774525.1 hypothetical protein [Olsenella profusa]